MSYIVHSTTASFIELSKAISEINPSFESSNEDIYSLIPAKVINLYISGTSQEMGQLSYDLTYKKMYEYNLDGIDYFNLLLDAEKFQRMPELYKRKPVDNDNVLNISMYDIMADRLDVIQKISNFINVDIDTVKKRLLPLLNYHVRPYVDEPSVVLVSFPGATGGHFVLTILDLLKQSNPPYNKTELPKYIIDSSGHCHNDVPHHAGHYNKLHELKTEIYAIPVNTENDDMDILTASYQNWTSDAIFPRSTTQHWRNFDYFLDNPNIMPGHKKYAILITPTADKAYDVGLQMSVNYFAKVSKVADQFNEAYEKVYFDCVGRNKQHTTLDTNTIIPLYDLNQTQMLEMIMHMCNNIQEYDIPVFTGAFTKGHIREDTLVLQFDDINNNIDRVIKQIAEFFNYEKIPQEVYDLAYEYRDKQPTINGLLKDRN